MVQNNYELKQSTILEMENEVLREQITDLKADIKKLEIEAQNEKENYRKVINDLIMDWEKILKI